MSASNENIGEGAGGAKEEEVVVQEIDPAENARNFLQALKKRDAAACRACFSSRSRLGDEVSLDTITRAFLRMGKQVRPATNPELYEDPFSFRADVGSVEARLCVDKTGRIDYLWFGARAVSSVDAMRNQSSWTQLFSDDYVYNSSTDDEFKLPPRSSKLSSITKWAMSIKGKGVSFADDRALQIGMGKPLPELPRNKFNVVFIRRYYRDSAWILLFVLYWIVQISLSINAFAKGSPSRLFSGFDSLGEICGNTANNSYGVDYSTRTKVFYPDGSSSSRGLCVASCPKAGDNVTDYIYAAGSSQSGAAFYTVNISTYDIANRCLPESGATTVVGSTAMLFSDLMQGWPAILVTIIAAFILGFIWVYTITRFPLKAIQGARMLSIVAGLFLALVSFGSVYLPNLTQLYIPAELKSSISNTGGDTFMIIAGVVALIFVLRIIFLAPELTNSLKVIQLTSQILRECDNAVIRCSGCLTGSFPTTAQGSDVQDDGDESKEADEPLPSSCNTSPLLIFPVLNALFLLGVFAFWCTVFVYLVSMGELKQNCMCGVSLNDCTCERYFQFDWGMRWSVLFHFYGLLWTCGIVLSVSETMFSTVISTWYFSEDKDLDGIRDLPPETTSNAFSIVMRHHLGTVICAAFFAPVVNISRPIAYSFLALRNLFQGVGRVSDCMRSCTAMIILSCCCFAQFAHTDIRAALVQVGLHGSSFSRGAEVGSKLKMRNAKRMEGLISGVYQVLFFSKITIFAASYGIGYAVLALIQGTSSSVSVGAPVFVLILAAIANYTMISIFVDVYAISLETVLIDFMEDCERNIRSTEVFMPAEFREFIDKYGYYKFGTFPKDPTALYSKIFKAKKLGVMHVATKEVVCQYSRVTSSAMVMGETGDEFRNDGKGWPLKNMHKTWTILSDVPVKHPSQPRNTLEVYQNKFGRAIWDNLFTFIGIPKTAWELGDFERFQFSDLMWDQWKLPVEGGGYYKLEPLSMEKVEKLATDEASWAPNFRFALPHVKAGQVKVFEATNERGLHFAMSEQQCLRLGAGCIRLLCNMRSLRVARRIVDADDAEVQANLAPPPELSEEERKAYLDLKSCGGDDASFQAWLRKEGLTTAKAVGEGKSHPKLRCARFIYIYLHQNFYFYDVGLREKADEMRFAKGNQRGGWCPTEPKDIVKGDIGSSGTMNNLYVACLRNNGIPARCLTGAWIMDNDGLSQAQGVHAGATEGEMTAMQYQKHTASEFFLDGVGWIPCDVTPIRLSADMDPRRRRERRKMGKAGWDKALTKNCLANFGNDGGQLLLSTAGFEMGAPLVCSGKAGRAPSGTHWDPEIDSDTWATAKTKLEIREFKVQNAMVASYTPANEKYKPLPLACTTPEDPNEDSDGSRTKEA